MKIKRGFALKNIGEKWVAVSLNDDIKNPDLLITMNNESAFVFRLLENDTDYDSVINAMTKRYDITQTRAKKDFDKFLDILRQHDLLDE